MKRREKKHTNKTKPLRQIPYAATAAPLIAEPERTGKQHLHDLWWRKNALPHFFWVPFLRIINMKNFEKLIILNLAKSPYERWSSRVLEGLVCECVEPRGEPRSVFSCWRLPALTFICGGAKRESDARLWFLSAGATWQESNHLLILREGSLSECKCMQRLSVTSL